MNELTLKRISQKAEARGMTPEEYINTMDTRFCISRAGTVDGTYIKNWDVYNTMEAAQNVINSTTNKVIKKIITEREAVSIFDNIKWCRPSQTSSVIRIGLR